MAKVKTANRYEGMKFNLSQYPNFSATGSVTGMKKLYGKKCLISQMWSIYLQCSRMCL